MLAFALAALVAAGCAYYLIVLAAARRFVRHRSSDRRRPGAGLTFDVLKPLAGAEPELRRNLSSFLALRGPPHEVLFAARDAGDPALAAARFLAAEFPGVRVRVIAAGESRWPNAKVHSLAGMTAISTGEVLVVSDSDIRAEPWLLERLAAEFEDERVGVVTCPYRAVPRASPWSLLEAIGMNTEFWSGVLAAQFLAPMDFAVGPTMAVRRSCLDAIGGWAALRDYLAEDFQIGRLAREAGYDVRLCTAVVEHRIGSQGLASNIAHRLRWRRSTRRSRPVGYWGEVFANPLPWAAILPAVAGWQLWSWGLLGVCAVLRAAAAVAVSKGVLGDTLVLRRWWLVPVQDVFSLLAWAAGSFGRRVRWRDRVYHLEADGRMRLLSR